MVETLARRTGKLVADGVCDAWLWRGRRVCLADGTTTTLPDTEENQAAYPQPGGQRKGLGFPIMRLVALLCLASGALLDAASGPCEGKGSDEQTLFRGLLEHLGEGDVLLGDAYFPTYHSCSASCCAAASMGCSSSMARVGAAPTSTSASGSARGTI
jgi:hypothetical protein